MGVPKFFLWLTRNDELKTIYDKMRTPAVINYGSMNADDLKELFRDVNSLFIDMNAWLHPTVREFYQLDKNMEQAKPYERERYDQKVNNYSNFDIDLKRQLSILVSRFRPRQLLYMAVDGMAPIGKMNQQKRRRFKSMKDRIVIENGEKVVKPVIFDTNVITPGTDFMRSVNDSLLSWINTLNRAEAHNYGYNISTPNETIYSNHETLGEGEHKIMDYLRKLPTQKGKIIIWGADADLLLLTLLLPRENVANTHNNIFIARENITKSGYVRRELVNMSVIREGLITYFRGKNLRPETHTDDQLIHDFVFLISMLGNDFLPKMPIFQLMIPSTDQLAHQYDSNINLLLDIYGKFTLHGKVLTIYDQEKQTWDIMWSNFGLFLAEFTGAALREGIELKPGVDLKFGDIVVHGNTEKSMLTTVARNMQLHPESLILQSLVTSGSALNPIHSFDYTKFINLWYNKATKMRVHAKFTNMLTTIGQNKTQSIASLIRGMSKNMAPNITVPDVLHSDPRATTQYHMNQMAHQYLAGMSWVFQYYQKGLAGVDFYFGYSYPYAPLMYTLAEYGLGLYFKQLDPSLFDRMALAPNTNKPNFGNYTTLHQLLSILPGTSLISPATLSGKTIPEWAMSITLPGGMLYDQYPDDFELDYQWVTPGDEWMAMEILPPIEPYRIDRGVSNILASDELKKEYTVNTEAIKNVYREARSANTQQSLFSDTDSYSGESREQSGLRGKSTRGQKSNDSRGYGGSRGYRGSSDSRGYRGSGDSRGYRGSGDSRGYRGSRGSGDSRGYSGSRGSGDSRGSRGSGDSRGYSGSGNSRGYSGSGNSRGYRGSGDSRGYRGSGDSRGYSGSGNSRGYRGSGDSRGSSGSRGSRGSE